MRRLAVAATTLAIALGATVAPAVGRPPAPAQLEVVDGEGWHPENLFQVRWRNPPAVGAPLTATHYRIRDGQENVISEVRFAQVRDGIAALPVPKVPGTYSIEVWLEDTEGDLGPAATARLRFDDGRPQVIEPRPVPDWIGRTAFPLRIRLNHPPGPLPISGIRGYAVTIDTAPGGAPRAAADRCTDTETTLRGGAEADTLTIATLPEGLNYLQAVAVSGSGMTSANIGRTVLRVDTTSPHTALTGAPPNWTREAVRLIATATDAGSGDAAGRNGPLPFTAIRVDGGAPATELGPSASARVIDEGAHLIAYYARDAAGNVDDGAWSNGIANRYPGTAWVRIDRTPPTLAFSNSQDPRDPDLLRVQIADRLSGADLARLDRRTASGLRQSLRAIAARRAGERRAACPLGFRLLSAGRVRVLRAIGYDTAGN